MRRFIIAVAVGVVAWCNTDVSRAAACTYGATYPPAIGRQTFLMATATNRSVTAATDSAWEGFRPRPVPAQVMTIDDVAGYQSDVLRDGLRASGGNAVFVRYGVSPGCSPFAARDGGFDSVGVSGLYVGQPRPRDRWIDGMPTFDILRAAAHYPLPQRLSPDVGYPAGDTTPRMSARELFTMYGALWSESVVAHDTSVEPRIRRWIRNHPDAARKKPAHFVTSVMLMSMMDSLVAQHPIPLGGTFKVTVTAPGVGSLVKYARTMPIARTWENRAVGDSLTGVPIALVPQAFAVDLMLADSVDGSGTLIKPCGGLAIVVTKLPIIPVGDSLWRGETYPTGFLDCVPPGSALAALTKREVMRTFADEPSTMTFRRHADGHVTFNVSARRGRSTGLVVRGERISTRAGY
jgi:hypothetical protein